MAHQCQCQCQGSRGQSRVGPRCAFEKLRLGAPGHTPHEAGAVALGHLIGTRSSTGRPGRPGRCARYRQGNSGGQPSYDDCDGRRFGCLVEAVGLRGCLSAARWAGARESPGPNGDAVAGPGSGGHGYPRVVLGRDAGPAVGPVLGLELGRRELPESPCLRRGLSLILDRLDPARRGGDGKVLPWPGRTTPTSSAGRPFICTSPPWVPP